MQLLSLQTQTGRDLSDLRQELKTDVHLVDIAVLCERFNTDLGNGKSSSGDNSMK
jgi:hypothetical protein